MWLYNSFYFWGDGSHISKETAPDTGLAPPADMTLTDLELNQFLPQGGEGVGGAGWRGHTSHSSITFGFHVDKSS